MTSAFVAFIIVVVKGVRKRIILNKAVTAHNILLNLRCNKIYSPRTVQGRTAYELSTWEMILTNPRFQNPRDKRRILFRRHFCVPVSKPTIPTYLLSCCSHFA